MIKHLPSFSSSSSHGSSAPESKSPTSSSKAPSFEDTLSKSRSNEDVGDGHGGSDTSSQHTNDSSRGTHSDTDSSTTSESSGSWSSKLSNPFSGMKSPLSARKERKAQKQHQALSDLKQKLPVTSTWNTNGKNGSGMIGKPNRNSADAQFIVTGRQSIHNVVNSGVNNITKETDFYKAGMNFGTVQDQAAFHQYAKTGKFPENYDPPNIQVSEAGSHAKPLMSDQDVNKKPPASGFNAPLYKLHGANPAYGQSKPDAKTGQSPENYDPPSIQAPQGGNHAIPILSDQDVNKKPPSSDFNAPLYNPHGPNPAYEQPEPDYSVPGAFPED